MKPASLLCTYASTTTNATLTTERRLAVTVLAGGISAERQVSLASGATVTEGLRACGYDVQQCDIAPHDLSALDRCPLDVVFPALHGAFGEDGQLQAILASRGITYCGSNAETSALAMDKAQSKRVVAAAGIPTPRFEVVAAAGDLDEQLHHWSLPVVIKPLAEGSSVGVEIIHDRRQFYQSVLRVVQDYGMCMIEQFVRGAELTVGIVGRQTLPPIEIRSSRDFYDYHAKYADDTTQYLFDIRLPERVLDQTSAMSLEVFDALGCRDFARVDWMVDVQTYQPWFIEINTIPGFTSHSLLPKAAARMGMDISDLCRTIVQLALRRGPD